MIINFQPKADPPLAEKLKIPATNLRGSARTFGGKNFALWILISIFLYMVLNLSCFAGQDKNSARYSFLNANRLYQESKFDQAITEYQKLCNGDIESANLYYNLGNCYFKKGELGRAILNYERARREGAGDGDLESNYEYAKSLIKESYSALSKPWSARIMDNISGKISIDGLTIICSILFIAVSVILGIFIFVHTPRFVKVLLAGLVILFIFSTFILINNKIIPLNKEAIIVAKIVDVKFEPLSNATTYFSLSEGNKVEIIEARQGWSKIRRSDGKIGWINKADLEII